MCLPGHNHAALPGSSYIYFHDLAIQDKNVIVDVYRDNHSTAFYKTGEQP